MIGLWAWKWIGVCYSRFFVCACFLAYISPTDLLRIRCNMRALCKWWYARRRRLEWHCVKCAWIYKIEFMWRACPKAQYFGRTLFGLEFRDSDGRWSRRPRGVCLFIVCDVVSCSALGYAQFTYYVISGHNGYQKIVNPLWNLDYMLHCLAGIAKTKCGISWRQKPKYQLFFYFFKFFYALVGWRTILAHCHLKCVASIRLHRGRSWPI